MAPPRTDRDIALVAATYRQAVAEARPTSDAIMAAFGCTYPVAVKLVQRARREGLLPPTSKGQKLAGLDHRPVIAVVHRNRDKERKFYVCETCLTLWPCSHHR